VRFNVLSRLGGAQARVQFTNRFSTVPLTIGAAHIALRASRGSIKVGTDRALTFNGVSSTTIAPGTELWSDPVTLTVPQHADVAISMYLPGSLHPKDFHPTGLKTSYVSSTGNYAAATTMPAPWFGGTTTMVFFISGLQVTAPVATNVVVCLGDSITDGAASAVDQNGAWPDVLSGRLPTLEDGTPVSVINMGIGSNRVVSSSAAGPSGVLRLDHDVLARGNVTHLIVLEGINDISYEHATSAQLIAAYQDVITRAHDAGIAVFGGTLLPIQNSTKYTAANEATREAVNAWIRTSGEFDFVLDFEAVVRDPQNPLRIRSDLTGDFVHPNTTGYRLMGQSIDLSLFEP
jgi:lysophospholipase L1-like esterase